jgi:AcrR family transcriptional regulator
MEDRPMTDVAVSRGEQTRERLLDIAQASVLEKGFGATSIEEIVTEAGISKNGFFYHFKDKSALASALLERYLAEESEMFDELFRRADELSDDPLHSFLIWLRLLAETMDDVAETFPACLVASITYQERLFDREVHERNAAAVLAWRTRFRARFEAIAEKYAPKEPVELDSLADMTTSVVEGGLIIGRALREPRVTGQQIMAFRTYVKLLFLPD